MYRRRFGVVMTLLLRRMSAEITPSAEVGSVGKP